MATSTVLVKKEGNIATLTFNRPEKMNAVNKETLETLMPIMAQIKDDSSIRVLIITGAGNSFCAGADLVYPFLGLDNTAEIRQFMNKVNSIVFNIRTMEKPVIAAVNGAAVGGGFAFALACDMIIASTKARFTPGFTGVGVHPDNGATYLLPRLVSFARATELFFTNRLLSAEEAERWGMVNKVVPPEQLESTVKELAQKLANSAPVALALTKNSLNQSLGMDLATMMELESKAQAICYLTEDCKEGVDAFLAKRKPNFKGR
ncbi:MAG: enoyl-CoA hydratase [Chloroflexota bacterium]